ncbi:MAG: hypothetical protein O2840_00500, partial [bacterium]|nr:hypothetical protein [bacterium]
AVETKTIMLPSGELGINSDLFSSKQTQVTQWQYRGHEIFEYKVDFSNESSNIYVVFWKYKKMLPGERVVIREDGRTEPLELSSNDYFTTGNKLTNRWSRTFNKLTIDRDISSDTNVYIEIVNDDPAKGLFYDEAQKAILESTRELEPIAETMILF